MRKELLLLAAAGTLIWGCAEWTETREMKAPPDLNTAEGVIEALDRHYQAVLSDLELTEDKEVTVKRTDGKYVKVRRSARFGGNRMTPIVPYHPDLWGPHAEEAKKLSQAMDNKWVYGVSLYGRYPH